MEAGDGSQIRRLCGLFGKNGRTTADIHFGITTSLVPDTIDNRPVTRVERLAVIGTTEREVIQRVRGEMAFAGAASVQRGIFFPDVATLTAFPGDTQLSVQVSDRTTGKWGVYLQDLEMPDYTNGLAFSDIAVAFKAGEIPGFERFRKGDAVVVPMANRSFRPGKHPSFYYEV